MENKASMTGSAKAVAQGMHGGTRLAQGGCTPTGHAPAGKSFSIGRPCGSGFGAEVLTYKIGCLGFFNKQPLILCYYGNECANIKTAFRLFDGNGHILGLIANIF